MTQNNFTRRDMMMGAAGLAALAVVPVKSLQAAPVLKPESTNQVPGFYHFTVGDLKASVIADGALPQEDIASTFAIGADKADVQDVLDAKFIPNAGAHLHCNALLLRSGTQVILFDCGGQVAPTSGKLVENLKASGVHPDQVSKVIISHAHPDHIFGAVDEQGRSVFKNASFLIHEQELAFWTGADAQMPKSLLPAETQKWMLENVKLKLDVIKPQIQTFKANSDLGHGVSAVDLAGHTAGHSGFLISSGSDSLLHFADAAHLYATALPHPEWKVLYDYDADKAIQTRKTLFDQLSKDKTRAFGYHFPYPGIGHVGVANNVYGWEQELWKWNI